MSLLVTGSTTTLTLIRSKVSAKLLGPEGFGLSAVLGQWIQLFAIGTAAVTGAALIGALTSAKDPKEVPGLLRTASVVVVAVNLVATALAVGAEWLVGGHGLAVLPLVVLSGLTSTLTTLSQIPQAVLISRQRLTRLSVLTVVSTTFNTLGIVVGTWFGGLQGQFIGQAAAAAVALSLFAALGTDQQLLGPLRDIRFDRDFVRRAFSIGLTSLIAGAALQLSLSSIRLTLERTADSEANGLFQAAWSLNGVAFSVLVGGLSTYAFPRFGTATTPTELQLELTAALRFVLRLVTPVALTAIALHDLAMPLLFSDRFSRADTLVALLIIGNVPRVMVVVLAGPLLYRARIRPYLVIEGLGALALGGVAPFLLGRLGLTGIGLVYILNALLLTFVARGFMATVEKVSGLLSLQLAGYAATVLVAGGYALQRAFPEARWGILAIGAGLAAQEVRRFVSVRNGQSNT